MDRDEAIFAANVQSLAALALLEDLFEFLAQQDADALRRFADAAAEKAEVVLANSAKAAETAPALGKLALNRGITQLKLNILAHARGQT